MLFLSLFCTGAIEANYHSTWDSKFIQHVRRQWQFFTGMMEQDSMPRIIPTNWKPKESVYDVLQMANIDRPFAEKNHSRICFILAGEWNATIILEY